MKYKVKAFMDALLHDEGHVVENVIRAIPFKWQDDTYTFTLEIKDIKKVETTEEFRTLEIEELK